MHQTPFVTDFAGFTADGAQWLLDHTDVRLLGTDYLTFTNMDDIVAAHDIILEQARRLQSPTCLPGWSSICTDLRQVEGSSHQKCMDWAQQPARSVESMSSASERSACTAAVGECSVALLQLACTSTSSAASPWVCAGICLFPAPGWES